MESRDWGEDLALVPALEGKGFQVLMPPALKELSRDTQL